MLHLVKYQFKQTVREHTTMFWALAFPIILGILFYVSFGSSDMGEDMEVIPVAVVEENTSRKWTGISQLSGCGGYGCDRS
ncbi:MAG: hypothetical protein V8S08_09200 [Lachnoclostridium sp.]